MSIDDIPVRCAYCNEVVSPPNTAEALAAHTKSEHPGQDPTYSAA